MMKKVLLLMLLLAVGCGPEKKGSLNMEYLEKLEAQASPAQAKEGGLLSAIAEGAWWVIKTTAKGAAINQSNPYAATTQPGSQIQSDDFSVLEPDGYGMGVHKNRFSQPVKLRPDFGGVYGERLEIKTDGYGMGVHVDQYGRPVREYGWP
jgi:hypothetical protein